MILIKTYYTKKIDIYLKSVLATGEKYSDCKVFGFQS